MLYDVHHGVQYIDENGNTAEVVAEGEDGKKLWVKTLYNTSSSVHTDYRTVDRCDAFKLWDPVVTNDFAVNWNMLPPCYSRIVIFDHVTAFGDDVDPWAFSEDMAGSVIPNWKHHRGKTVQRDASKTIQDDGEPRTSFAESYKAALAQTGSEDLAGTTATILDFGEVEDMQCLAVELKLNGRMKAGTAELRLRKVFGHLMGTDCVTGILCNQSEDNPDVVVAYAPEIAGVIEGDDLRYHVSDRLLFYNATVTNPVNRDTSASMPKNKELLRLAEAEEGLLEKVTVTGITSVDTGDKPSVSISFFVKDDPSYGLCVNRLHSVLSSCDVTQTAPDKLAIQAGTDMSGHVFKLFVIKCLRENGATIV